MDNLEIHKEDKRFDRNSKCPTLMIRKIHKYYCSAYFSYKFNALQYVISIIIKPITLYIPSVSGEITVVT